jgi:hypothetical protein
VVSDRVYLPYFCSSQFRLKVSTIVYEVRTCPEGRLQVSTGTRIAIKSELTVSSLEPSRDAVEMEGVLLVSRAMSYGDETHVTHAPCYRTAFTSVLLGSSTHLHSPPLGWLDIRYLQISVSHLIKTHRDP